MGSSLRFWIAFVLILSLSLLANQFLFETPQFLSHSKATRNFLELAAIALVGITGMVYFLQHNLKLLRWLWMLLYAGGIIFLLIVFVIDSFVFEIEKNGQFRFGSLKGLLVSPVPFLVLILANKIYFTKK